MNPLTDTMVSDLYDRGPTLCIHTNTIYVLKVLRDTYYCGDGCCSWDTYTIDDYLTDTTPTIGNHDTIIPILELSPEWDAFLKARGFDPTDLDLSPMF